MFDVPVSLGMYLTRHGGADGNREFPIPSLMLQRSEVRGSYISMQRFILSTGTRIFSKTLIG